MFGVHWSLEAWARSWLAASVVSRRSVMVKAENRSCGQWMGRAVLGQSWGFPSRLSPVSFPPLPSSPSSPRSPASSGCGPSPPLRRTGALSAAAASPVPSGLMLVDARKAAALGAAPKTAGEWRGAEPREAGLNGGQEAETRRGGTGLGCGEGAGLTGEWRGSPRTEPMRERGGVRPKDLV